MTIYNFNLFGINYNTDNPRAKPWFIGFFSVILFLMIGMLITSFAFVNFILRVIDANYDAWSWLNPGNVFGYIFIILVLGFIVSIIGFSVRAISGIVWSLLAFVFKIRTFGSIVTIAIINMIIMLVLSILIVNYGYDYSSKHWEDLTGIFDNDGSGFYRVLMILMVFGVFTGNSESSDN